MHNDGDILKQGYFEMNTNYYKQIWTEVCT